MFGRYFNLSDLLKIFISGLYVEKDGILRIFGVILFGLGVLVIFEFFNYFNMFFFVIYFLWYLERG